MSASAAWQGLDQVIAQYGIAAASVPREAQDALTRASAPVLKALAQEPPPRPGQHYVRTHELRSGWLNARPTFRVGLGGVSLSLSNPSRHTEHTQVHQAWMHVGRWQPLDVAQRQLTEVYGPLELAAMAGRIAARSEGR